MVKRRFSRLAKSVGIVAAFCLVFGLTGCGGGGSGGGQSPTNPNGVGTIGTATGTLSSSTVYLSVPSDTPTNITGTTVTLPGNRTNIKFGSVLLSSLGTGFVRKVAGVSVSGGNTVVQTTDASLPDAFSELHTKCVPAFTQDNIGDIASDVPGLDFKWVASSSPSPSTPIASHGVRYNTLEMDFNKLGVSGSGNTGMSLTGSAQLQVTPEFDLDINRAPGDFLPSVAEMTSNCAMSVTGSLTLTANAGGSIAGSRKWFDKPIGKPMRVGWLVIVPHLTVESDIAGSASGNLAHTTSVALSASAGENYVRGQGWTSTKSFTPSLPTDETNIDAEFNAQLIPIKITVAFYVYDIAGPFGSIDANISAQGTTAVSNGIDGIQASVTGGLEGSIGLTGQLPDSFANFFGGSGASFTPVEADFPLVSTSLFSQFFPYSHPADIVIEDNGDATDSEDSFQVQLDGNPLGYTAKGSDGTFHVNNLAPGSHVLSVTYTDLGADDETGDPPAELDIALNNGMTFADGTTSVSQSNLPFDVPQTFTIVVPTGTSSLNIAHIRLGGKDRARHGLKPRSHTRVTK